MKRGRRANRLSTDIGPVIEARDGFLQTFGDGASEESVAIRRPFDISSLEINSSTPCEEAAAVWAGAVQAFVENMKHSAIEAPVLEVVSTVRRLEDLCSIRELLEML